jgi:hypothetical protein
MGTHGCEVERLCSNKDYWNIPKMGISLSLMREITSPRIPLLPTSITYVLFFLFSFSTQTSCYSVQALQHHHLHHPLKQNTNILGRWRNYEGLHIESLKKELLEQSLLDRDFNPSGVFYFLSLLNPPASTHLFQGGGKSYHALRLLVID